MANDVYLSTVTLEKLKGCSEPKQSQLFDYLGQTDYTSVKINDNITEIAQQIIEMRILTNKSYDDCQHIGAAIISEYDCIISWNFKHIVNIKIIRGVRVICVVGKRGIIMDKPVLSPDFTIEDIHKLREYNYYQTKDMSSQDRIDYYNSHGMEVHRIIQERKLQKIQEVL